MGRIKTTLIKRVTHELMDRHGNEFTEDFKKNKEIVNTLISTPSKNLRNKIVGYVTRLAKKMKSGERTPQKRDSETDYDNVDS